MEKRTLKTLFKKRKYLEENSFIYKLCNKRIKMYDSRRVDNSLKNYWMISANPHIRSLASTSLEKTMRFIFSTYYYWLYGSLFRKLKELQYRFKGVIELQDRKDGYHTHFIMECRLEDIRLFYGYFSYMFQFIYPSSSFQCSQVYDPCANGDALDYCATQSHKDTVINKKRIEYPIFISHKTFQGKIDDPCFGFDEFISFADD